MLVIGKRLIPWLLHYVAHTGSRELFRLCGAGHRARRRLRRQRAVRRLVRARRLLRGHDPERIRAQPARRPGDAAAARRLRRAVLRLGRHAGRSHDRHRASRCRCWRPSSSSCSASRSRPFSSCACSAIPTSHALTISASLAQIGEFSFILAGPRRQPRAAAGARPRPDPGRRHHLDPAQSAAVCLRSTATLPSLKPAGRRAAPKPDGQAAGESQPASPCQSTASTDHVVLDRLRARRSHRRRRRSRMRSFRFS